MNDILPYPVPRDRKSRLELAEARASKAEARTEQARTRTEAAETRAEHAEARTESAKTRTEQAETRAEEAEMRAEQAETAMEIMVHEKADAAPHHTASSDETGLRALARLTSRQREILQLIAKGENTKQIAGALEISPKTVEYHRIKVMSVLGLHDVTGLVRFALRVGLIPADG